MEWAIIIILFVAIVVFGYRYHMRVHEANEAEFKAKTEGYNSSVEDAIRNLCTGSNSASLPILDAKEFGYRLMGAENLLAVQDGATRMQMKSTGQYRTEGASVSVPVGRGVRFRVGSGNIQAEKEWQATAYGRFLVTDKALVFEGKERNERVTWNRISSVAIFFDEVQIAKRTGPPQIYSVDSVNPEFAAIVHIMLTRTG